MSEENRELTKEETYKRIRELEKKMKLIINKEATYQINLNGMDYRISELRNQIQGIHNKQVGHIDIEHKEILNKQITELEKNLKGFRNELVDNFHIEFDDIDKKISELIKIVYDLIQDIHIGVLNSSGAWSLLLDRLKKLGGEVCSAAHTEKISEDPYYPCGKLKEDLRANMEKYLYVEKEKLENAVSHACWHCNTEKACNGCGVNIIKEKYLGGKS